MSTAQMRPQFPHQLPHWINEPKHGIFRLEIHEAH